MNLKLLENFVSKDVITNIIVPYLLPKTEDVEENKRRLNYNFAEYWDFVRWTKHLKVGINKSIKDTEDKISKLKVKKGVLYNYHNIFIQERKKQLDFIKKCDKIFRIGRVDGAGYCYDCATHTTNPQRHLKHVPYFYFHINVSDEYGFDKRMIARVEDNTDMSIKLNLSKRPQAYYEDGTEMSDNDDEDDY